MLLNMETFNEAQRNPDLLTIRGKAVVIVGGATEIGRATASLLAGRGARVLVTARNSSELSAVLKEVCHMGNEVHGMVVSLDQPEEIRRFFQEAERRLGGMDILINHLDGTDYGQKTGAETCQNVCTAEGIAHMQARARGHIINIDLPSGNQAILSVTGAGPLPDVSAALRRQANDLGIRVTLIESGTGASRDPDASNYMPQPEDIARCVYDTIVQPYSVDLILVKGQKQPRQN